MDSPFCKFSYAGLFGVLVRMLMIMLFPLFPEQVGNCCAVELLPLSIFFFFYACVLGVFWSCVFVEKNLSNKKVSQLDISVEAHPISRKRPPAKLDSR